MTLETSNSYPENLEKYYEPANSYFQKQNFCHLKDFEMLQYLRHSESLEKYYEFTNSYFSCYSESVNADGYTIKLNRFRISGTRIKRISASPSILSLNSSTLKTLHLRHFVPAGSGLSLSGFQPYGISLCSCLSGMTILCNLYQFVMTAKNNVCKKKESTTMTKNENVKKILKAGALTKRHSEGIRPKNPLHILKRFFAKYKFPFAGNYIKPAQNDGKLLVPFSPLSLPSPSVLLRSHNTGTAIAFHPLLACAWGEGSKNVMDLSSYRPIDFSTFKKRAAFTLAEVLITLGVIGIIAAMTIPALISANNKRITETRLKRFYSTFNQAIRLSTIDNGEVEGWTDYWDASTNFDDEDENAKGKRMEQVNSSFEKYLLPYMKVMYKKEVQERGSKHTLYVLADGSAFSFIYNGNRDITFFPKNAEKCIEHTSKAGICSFMFIFHPINNSRDWKYHYKQGLEPYKYNWDGKRESLYSSCQYNVFFCTEIIKQNGWKIPADYPLQIRYY